MAVCKSVTIPGMTGHVRRNTHTALLVIPGPTILTVVSYSIAQGARANVPLVLAVALGDSTALLFSLLGLGALLTTSAFWFTVV